MENDLGSIVGNENVVIGEKEKKNLKDSAWGSTILSLGFKIEPDAIVKPHNAREIVDIVNYAFDRKIPLIPRGGGTSALGEALPIKGGVVLEMKRVNKIEIDEDKKTLTAGAGISWSKMNAQLKKKGFTIGVSPLNEDSTLGGFISTGGYGIGSLMHGSIGNRIVNLEVVLPVGLRINTGYSKTSLSYGFGYNNSWLFSGAEGTLGVITEATLKIYHQNNLKVTVYRIIKDEPLFQGLSELAQSGNLISAVFFDGELSKTKLGIEADRGVILLLSEDGREDVSLEKAHGAISMFEEDFNLWAQLRKIYHPDGFGGEVFLPLDSMPKIFEVVRKLKESYQVRGLVGFLADADSIILRLICGEEESGLKRIALIGEFVKAAIDWGGRPYGSGVWNSFWMEDVFDADTLKLMRKIKEQIDPQNIMNPYKNINYPKARAGLTAGPSLFQTSAFLEKIFKRIRL